MKLSAVVACYRDAPAVPIMYERLVGAFEKTACSCCILEITLCCLLFEDLIVRTIAGFSGFLPLRNRFPKQVLIRDFVKGESSP